MRSLEKRHMLRSGRRTEAKPPRSPSDSQLVNVQVDIPSPVCLSACLPVRLSVSGSVRCCLVNVEAALKILK